MDILPEIESVNFQKISHCGGVTNRIVKVSDLEKVDKETLNGNLFPTLFCDRIENYFDYFNKQTLDKDLIFRNKANGELFMFDKKGLWDWNNLNHELIN